MTEAIGAVAAWGPAQPGVNAVPAGAIGNIGPHKTLSKNNFIKTSTTDAMIFWSSKGRPVITWPDRATKSDLFLTGGALMPKDLITMLNVAITVTWHIRKRRDNGKL